MSFLLFFEVKFYNENYVILLIGDTMNLDVLIRELKYLIEDELHKNKIESYPGIEEEIEELMHFFLSQRVEYQLIPDMVNQMFMNPPEVIFIKEDGNYERKKLTANGLHLSALMEYGKDMLVQNYDEDLEMELMTANPDCLTKYFYEQKITVIRIFHNSIVGKSFAATTPITSPIVEETYQQLEEQLKKEKNGKIEFGIYDLYDYSYNFTEESKKIK